MPQSRLQQQQPEDEKYHTDGINIRHAAHVTDEVRGHERRQRADKDGLRQKLHEGQEERARSATRSRRAHFNTAGAT
eukprot:scaffold20540_cov101-Isochrysis_galbana.AAC.4